MAKKVILFLILWSPCFLFGADQNNTLIELVEVPNTASLLTTESFRSIRINGSGDVISKDSSGEEIIVERLGSFGFEYLKKNLRFLRSKNIKEASGDLCEVLLPNYQLFIFNEKEKKLIWEGNDCMPKYLAPEERDAYIVAFLLIQTMERFLSSK